MREARRSRRLVAGADRGIALSDPSILAGESMQSLFCFSGVDRAAVGTEDAPGPRAPRQEVTSDPVEVGLQGIR